MLTPQVLCWFKDWVQSHLNECWQQVTATQNHNYVVLHDLVRGVNCVVSGVLNADGFYRQKRMKSAASERQDLGAVGC